jgi:hypothetical protein
VPLFYVSLLSQYLLLTKRGYLGARQTLVIESSRKCRASRKK